MRGKTHSYQAGSMTWTGARPYSTPIFGARLQEEAEERLFIESMENISPSFFPPSQVFVALALDGNAPLPGAPVARVSDVFTPATAPPTITAVQAVNVTVDEAAGSFSLALNATLDRPGIVYYALYRCVLYTAVLLCPQLPAGALGTGTHFLRTSAKARRVLAAAALRRPTGAPALASWLFHPPWLPGGQLNTHCTSYTARHLYAACLVSHRAYSCISGDPSVSDILSGASLAPSICPCSESWYCRWVVLVLRVGGGWYCRWMGGVWQ